MPYACGCPAWRRARNFPNLVLWTTGLSCSDPLPASISGLFASPTHDEFELDCMNLGGDEARVMPSQVVVSARQSMIECVLLCQKGYVLHHVIQTLFSCSH